MLNIKAKYKHNIKGIQDKTNKLPASTLLNSLAINDEKNKAIKEISKHITKLSWFAFNRLNNFFMALSISVLVINLSPQTDSYIDLVKH